MNSRTRSLAVQLPFLLTALFAAGTVFAQEKPKPLSLSEEIAKRYGDKVELHLNQPYAGTKNQFQMLDLYLPKQRVDNQPLPVVVHIHGGGWSSGNRAGYGGSAAGLAASGKYAAISVGYRLSGEAKWPAQIHDCKAAIRWIRGHAKEFNLDPEHIGATGGSAGGHLVTLLGLTPGVKELEGNLGEFTSLSSAVTCVVNVCGPTDMTTVLIPGATTDDPAVSGLLGGLVKDRLDLARQSSPLTYVTASAVPIMTIHGTKDMRVNFTNAEKLDAALKRAGTTSLLIPVTDAGHGVPFGPELNARVQQFWAMYLRGVKSEIATTPIQAPPAPVKK
ncbi:MAG: alpha/beta hydrolase [Proteobacteria bacterium]|nr:alpha/beta hydrolase [Pseudomonadota bacterium]